MADELGRIGAAKERTSGRIGAHGSLLVAGQGVVDGFDQITEIEGLSQVVEGTETHGLHGGFNAAVAGDHDHGGLGSFDGAGLNDIQAADVADAEVHDDQLRTIRPNSSQTIGTCQRREHRVANRAAKFAHEFQNGTLVIYDNYFGHGILLG